MTDIVMQNVGGKSVPMLVAEKAPLARLAETLHISTDAAITVLDDAFDILQTADSKDAKLSVFLDSRVYQQRLTEVRDIIDGEITLQIIADFLGVPVDYVGSAFMYALGRADRKATGGSVH